MTIPSIAVVVMGGAPAVATELMTFDNGLHVVLTPVPGASRVATNMVIEAGTLDDPEGREGIAHLVEHLWFDSRTDDGPVAWDRLRGSACDVSAETWLEYTRFAASCPPSVVFDLLTMEIRRLREPLAGIDDHAVDLAWRVIAAEDAGLDDAVWELGDTLWLTLYPTSQPLQARLTRPELAPMLTADDAFAFVQTWYRPAFAVLSITGDFDPAAVRSWLTAHVGPVTTPAPRPPRRPGLPYRRTLRVAPRTLPAPVDHPTVSIAWSLPPGAAGYFERDVLARIATYALRQRYLHDATVIDLGCFPDDRAFATPILCLIELADEADAGVFAEALGPTLEGLWAAESAGELRELLSAMRSQARVAIRGAVEGGSLAAGLALVVLLGGQPRDAADAENDLRDVTVAGLLDLAREHLAADRALVVAWRPDPRRRTPLQPEVDPPAPDRPSAPFPPRAPDTLDAAERTLPNGRRVVAVRRPGAVLLHAAARVPTHPSLDDGIADLIAERSDGGIPASLLRDVVPWTHRTPDAVVEGVYGEATDPLRVLERLRARLDVRRIVLDPREPWLERERLIAERARDDARWWAEALPRAALDPTGTARARVALTHFDGMRAAQLDTVALDAGLEATFNPARTVVVLVGPDDPAEMLDAAERVLGPPPGQAPIPEDLESDDVVPLELPSVVVIDDPELPAATLSWRCPVRGDQATHAVLGELLSLRILAELRWNTGWSYSPTAWTEQSGGGTTHLAVEATVPHARLTAALETVERLVDELSVGVADTDLRRAHEDWLWAHGPAAPEVGTLLWLTLDGPQRAEDLRLLATRVRAVTPVDVREALGGCRTAARAAVAGNGVALAAALTGRDVQVWTVGEARERVR